MGLFKQGRATDLLFRRNLLITGGDKASARRTGWRLRLGPGVMSRLGQRLREQWLELGGLDWMDVWGRQRRV